MVQFYFRPPNTASPVTAAPSPYTAAIFKPQKGFSWLYYMTPFGLYRCFYSNPESGSIGGSTIVSCYGGKMLVMVSLHFKLFIDSIELSIEC